MDLQTYRDRNVALDRLLTHVAGLGCDAAILTFSDLYQNEFPKQELAPISTTLGFLGSAGTVGPTLRPLAIIGFDRSSVFVDSRYVLEAQDFFRDSPIETNNLNHDEIKIWLRNATRIKILAIDFNLFTINEKLIIENELLPNDKNFEIRKFDYYKSLHLLDYTFNQAKPFLLHGSASDFSSQHKIQTILNMLSHEGCDCYVTTNNEEVAWILNIRALENPFLPCPNAWLAIMKNGAASLYFPCSTNLVEDLSSTLKPMPLSIYSGRQEWANNIALGATSIIVDKYRTNSEFYRLLTQRSIDINYEKQSPAPQRMCVKTSGEIHASIHAHWLDGIAKTRFLYRIHTCPSGYFTEYESVQLLHNIRKQSKDYMCPSFPWVSCVSENASKPHYKPARHQCATLTSGNCYLIDSGGQYPGATTDVTRTVWLGDVREAPHEFRLHFTLALQGLIRATKLKFPAGTTAAQLDAIVRSPLWTHAKDYAHGTGHGVGAGLSIHEPPIIISPKARDFSLLDGMIFSLEPSFYEPKKWGLRIENLVVVRRYDTEGTILWIDTLTDVPIQASVPLYSLLNQEERAWLEGYNQRVVNKLSESLTVDERRWLERYIAPD